jgi:hypothetical protein
MAWRNPKISFQCLIKQLKRLPSHYPAGATMVFKMATVGTTHLTICHVVMTNVKTSSRYVTFFAICTLLVKQTASAVPTGGGVDRLAQDSG